ncbi:MAG: CesT family type III secretion system chaperone [Simkaniaceae bacterium]|nr:CesT family type III secretion system chaperone [Simkaniaceae bacterium]
MQRFEEILWDLGELIGEPLHIDENRVCKLLIDETLPIQLEMDMNQEMLMVGSFIVEIPAGKFRENVLKEGLKANNTRQYGEGILSYVERNNSLVMFDYLYAKSITGESLITYLKSFIINAKSWRNAIETGTTLPTEGRTNASNNLPPPFGR